MVHGVLIEKGPEDWQILQQKNGYACIYLDGVYRNTSEDPVHCEVFARVVLEDSGDAVCHWKKCESVEGDESKGKWKVILENIPAGGLYRIETCLHKDNEDLEWSSRGDMIHHLGVGDIYVIAGQSNSAGYGKDQIYDPSELGVHILRNSGKWDLASHPFNESTNTCHEINMETANPGHSPYLSFAKMLKRHLNHPIGLIQTALGGSPLSDWNPEENGHLYKNMIKIVREQGNSVSGILWYQGCSDASSKICSNTYLERFECMVKNIRTDLMNEQLPIFTVQLNRYIGPGDMDLDRSWGMLREAQRQAARQMSHVYIVPSNDCTLSDAIHISALSNMKLGERLARLALHKIYGKSIFCQAPDIESAYYYGNKEIVLEFGNIYQKLFTFDDSVKELPFTIEDEKGFVKIKGYELKGPDKFILKMERAPQGKTLIHGAFQKNPKFFLPMDFATHLSMLSFYGVELKRDIKTDSKSLYECEKKFRKL